MITIIGEIGRPATQEEIDSFLNTKKWSEMTEKEIIEHKKEQCEKCEYLSGIYSKDYFAGKTCDYIVTVGHSRGCSPLDCVLFGVFKRKIKTKRARKMR